MKKVLISLFTLSLLIITVVATSCSQEAKEDYWCPVGTPSDYETVKENKRAEAYVLSSKKGYHGAEKFARSIHPTHGWFYFKTNDVPVKVKFTKKTYEKINVKVQTGLVDNDGKITTDIPDLNGAVIPPNSLLKIDYSATQFPMTDSICFEYFLYCE